MGPPRHRKRDTTMTTTTTTTTETGHSSEVRALLLAARDIVAVLSEGRALAKDPELEHSLSRLEKAVAAFCSGCGEPHDECTCISAVIDALAGNWEVKKYNDDSAVIRGVVPQVKHTCEDRSECQCLEPGSAWWDECDSRLEDIRSLLPSGWTAEFSDDDVIIERE